MSKIYAGSAQHVPAGSTVTVAPSTGKLWAILAASSNNGGSDTIVLYDNTAASVPLLFQVMISAQNSPWQVIFPAYRPLTFATGLTIVSPATANCIVIVEY